MTKIVVPVELTFSRLNDAAASRINTLHSLIGKPLVAEGELNPYREMLSDMAYGGIGFSRTPMAESGDIDQPEFITIDQVALIVALGGDFVGLPVFFELATDPSTTDCPFSTTTPKEKWSTWGTFGNSHVPTKIGNNWYRESNVGQTGRPMNASEWIPVMRNSTITKKEYDTINQENSPLVP